MKFHMSLAAALTVAVASVSYAAPTLVDSTAILDPNPSNLGITEVGSTGLTAARALITAGRAAGRSGVIDFQQQGQGGTFPNSTANDNGVDLAAGPANPLNVTIASVAGAGGLVATGPTVFSFYRLESDGTGANNDIDSNLNQGGNVISGGYLSRYPGAVSATNPLGDGSAVTGMNPNLLPTVSIGGAYAGITNTGSPATLVFDGTPLSFFGITALPRGATRSTTVTLTEVPVNAAGVPIVGGAAISVVVNPTGTVVGTNAVFFGQTANVGYAITRAALTDGGTGVNRYDDVAFVLATVPEPTTLAAVAGLGGLLLRRRRSI